MRIKSLNPLVVCGVIGDVLNPFTNSVSLRIVYDNNKEATKSSSWWKVMVDPDGPSPSNPNMREYLHW